MRLQDLQYKLATEPTVHWSWKTQSYGFGIDHVKYTV